MEFQVFDKSVNLKRKRSIFLTKLLLWNQNLRRGLQWIIVKEKDTEIIDSLKYKHHLHRCALIGKLYGNIEMKIDCLKAW